MKIPKYIEQKLNYRAKLAEKLIEIDYQLTEWIDNNGIKVEPYDYNKGTELYEAPYESINRIKEAIRKG